MVVVTAAALVAAAALEIMGTVAMEVGMVVMVIMEVGIMEMVAVAVCTVMTRTLWEVWLPQLTPSLLRLLRLGLLSLRR